MIDWSKRILPYSREGSSFAAFRLEVALSADDDGMFPAAYRIWRLFAR